VPAGDSADAEDGNDTGVDRVGTCTETGAEVVVVVKVEIMDGTTTIIQEVKEDLG